MYRKRTNMNSVRSILFIQILLLVFSDFANSEVFDVTTLYKFEKSLVPILSEEKTVNKYHYKNKARIEVHGHNNALSIPFLLNNGTIAEPNLGIDTESNILTAFDNDKWEKNNILPVALWGNNPLKNKDGTYSVYLNNNVTDAKYSYYSNNEMKITAKYTLLSSSAKFAIFLIGDKGSVKSSDMYYIDVSHNPYGNSNIYIYKCTDNNQSGGSTYTIPSGYTRRCAHQTSNSFRNRLDGSFIWSITISKSNGNLKIQITSSKLNGNTDALHWTDNNPIDLVGKEGSLISPVFSPNTNKLCVSVNYAEIPDIRSDLHLSAIWPDWETSNFSIAGQYTHNTNGRNWNFITRRYITDIPEEKKSKPLKVKLQAYTSESVKLQADSSESFHILRIAGCNGDDLEDVLLLSESEEVDLLELQGYDVTIPRDENNLQNQTACKHGGKFDSGRGGCVCPAGFMGTSCETGCGPNIYGSKCDRRCSKTKRGCEGIKLCRPNLACTCAAGLMGDFCDIKCDKGYYGADCKETCGHCKNDMPCDPYTGSCPLEKEILEYYSMKIKFTLDTVNLAGIGNPWFYQVQYREHDNPNNSWYEASTHEITSSVVACNITGLKPATKYDTRVVLINDDGGSYQGADIATAVFRTNCEVPKVVDYTLQGKKMEALFTDLLSGQQFNVRVRAVTIDGPMPFSDFLVVTTKDEVPGEVFNLKLVSKTSDNLEISWLPPLFTAGKIQGYKVTYQCQSLLACKEENCSYSSGMIEVTNNSTNLHGLLPFAKYLISVSAKAASWGPAAHLLTATETTVPQISPESNSVSHRTNSSLMIHWSYPTNCSHFNGFVYGYRYEFYGSDNVILKEKNITNDNKETFTGLSPTPGPVKELTVYKRGRRMLGFRWAAPEATYGDIESFTVTYKREGYEAVSSVLQPRYCTAWPKLYCHSFNNLHPDTEYTLMVQARNNEVAEDGEASTITTITKEYAPQAPSFIRVESQTQTDIALEWGLPNMVNGVLRSFLVNVEETDSYNVSACCQYFPLQEVPVRFEQEKYRLQFTGLQPASTYTVSVSAKTIAMGPPITMTAHTRPPVPSINGTIELSELTSLSAMTTINFNPITEFQELISKYLVIVSSESSDIHMPNTEIKDEWLKKKLSQLVNGTFYVAQELSPGELKKNPEVELGSDSEPLVGKWADSFNPELKVGEYYRIGLAVILDYCGMLSVAYTETEPLEVLKEN
ncbi:hypothetical protein C0J52_10389 [Blattella germanica]|nr:hypothetical protein C0J52_10389 [Blattella germanica]